MSIFHFLSFFFKESNEFWGSMKHTSHADFLWREIVSPSHSSKADRPPLVG